MTNTINTQPQKCGGQHMGPWMVNPQWFAQAVAAVKAGTFVPYRAFDGGGEPGKPAPLFTITNGIAVIPIFGQVTKGESSYGGASSVRTRQAIRAAVNDQSVKAILLHIDSPGGTVSGTGDLAADVAAADDIKPVVTYFEDMGCSAAYWVGSQSRRVYANPTAVVGSIGTMTYVEDTSGMYEKAGIKVTLIATGKYKGQWIDGNPVSEDYIKEVRTEVEDLNEHFLHGVMSGRGMSREKLAEIADGRVFIASKALAHGLIDEVATLESALHSLALHAGITTRPVSTTTTHKETMTMSNTTDTTKRETKVIERYRPGTNVTQSEWSEARRTSQAEWAEMKPADRARWASEDIFARARALEILKE